MKKVMLALQDGIFMTLGVMWRNLWYGVSPLWVYAFIPTWLSLGGLFLMGQVQPQYQDMVHLALLSTGLSWAGWLMANVLCASVSRYHYFLWVIHECKKYNDRAAQPPAPLWLELQRIT
jgi:hypothetical protein